MDRTFIYDLLYALVAQNGREAALFGACGPIAHEAFERSLVADAFPELWFELPLLGEPWLDLHALTSYRDVAGKQATFAGLSGVYNDALAWFAGQAPGKVRQLALSYDTHAGDVGSPAVQLLVNGPDPTVPQNFLAAAHRAELQAAYKSFVRAMPAQWYACYTGVFPGRDAAGTDPWVRVECIVGAQCQQAYANDISALAKHLASIGMHNMGSDLVVGVQELAKLPFPLELQFNVRPDGTALPALSASVRFQPRDLLNLSRRDVLLRLLGWVQARGLADDRCELLPQTVFAKRAQRAGEAVTISCLPAFIKLRWREGYSPDAKAYLIAQANRGRAS